MLFILVVTVVVLIYCRNSMFEVVVDCMFARLKIKVWGLRGGWGGGAPLICKRTGFPAKKKLSKEIVEY